MAYTIGQPQQQQYFDDNGDPAVNHTLEFFVAGTSTPASVAFDPAGVATATTVTIDSQGFPASGGSAVTIYFDNDVTYDIVRKDSGGVAFGATVEDFAIVASGEGTVSGVLSGGSSAADAIVASISPAPASLTDQLQVVVELQHSGNITTTPTFNLNGLGATTIVRGSGIPLRIGDTGGAGYKCYLSYSATLSKWVLLNPAMSPQIAYLVAGASDVNALVAAYTPVQGALTDQLTLILELDHGANTSTTPTLNLNGLGATTIVRDNNQALNKGDLGGSGYKCILSYSSTLSKWVLLNPALPKHNYGLEWRQGLTVTNGTDSEHDVDVAVGKIMDSSNAYVLDLQSAFTKQIDSVFAVGTASGGLSNQDSSGVVQNSTVYQIFLISKSTNTSDCDVIFATTQANALADTVAAAAGFDIARRIGWAITDGSANIHNWLFDDSLTYRWDVISDETISASATRALVTCRVPPNCMGRLIYMTEFSGASQYGILTQVSQTDTAPSATAFHTLSEGTGNDGNPIAVNIKVDSNRQIYHRESTASVDTIALLTVGYKDDLTTWT